MGQSSSVEKLKNDNQEFSDFLDQAIANLKSRQGPVIATFDQKIDDFYNFAGNNWRQQPQAASDEIDFRQTSEQNLSLMKPFIKDTAETILAGLPIAAKASAGMLPQAAIVSIAVLAVIEVMGYLSTNATSTFREKYLSKHLGPGLMLHMYCMTDFVKESRWFNNREIAESIIGYKVIYSPEQAVAESVADIIAAFHDEIDDLARDLQNSLQDYISEKDKYRELIKDHKMAEAKEAKEFLDMLKEIHTEAEEELLDLKDKVNEAAAELA